MTLVFFLDGWNGRWQTVQRERQNHDKGSHLLSASYALDGVLSAFLVLIQSIPTSLEGGYY